MCLVSVVNNNSDQNLIAYQLHNDIYFSAQKDIRQGEELKVWYSTPYEKKLKKTVENEKFEIRKAKGDQEILSTKNLMLSSDLSNKKSDNTIKEMPVKRRRGRPPKVQSVESHIQRNESLLKVSNEDVVCAHSPDELGVMEEQQKWKCSQCSALYDNCIDFARHLQEHYRPPSYRKRDKGSGASQKDTEWIYNRAIRQNFRGNHKDRAKRVKKCKFAIRKLKNCERKIAGKCRNKLHTKSMFTNHSEIEEYKDFCIYKEKEDNPSKFVENLNNCCKVQSNYNITSFRSKKLIYGISKEQDNCNNTEKKLYESKTTKRPTVISLHEGEQMILKNDKESVDAKEKVNTNYKNDLAIVECQSPTIINVSEDSSITKSLVNSENALVSIENEETSSTSEWSDTPKVSLVDDQWKGKNLHVAILNFECKSEPKKYSCDLCSKSFNKTCYLFRHIKKHTGEFTCSICQKVFARKENMLKHVCIKSTKGDGKEFDHECSYCKKKFSTDRLLLRHMAKHTGEFTCNECGKPYSTKDTLLNHVCSLNPSTESYNCPVCSKAFSKNIYLIKHLPVHTGQHSCPICGKWLRSADSLTNHLRMCNQVQEIEEKGKSTCASCHKEFTDVTEFRRHQYQHTHIHSCDSCGAKFRNLVSLHLHVCHGSSIICDICNKVFTSISSMRQHRVSHGEQLKCSDCGKYFNNKIMLRRHFCDKINAETNQKTAKETLHPLICEVCGSKFSSSSSLNVHKNLHGEKKFVCKVCGKKFHRKDLLVEHYAVHGDPTFPCTTCSKLFKTKKSLDVHMMIHEGIKRFQCSTCGKEFYQKGNLQKHQETHNKERKYSCSVCQKSFATKEYLKVHIAEHTWGRIYMCGICKKSFVRPHQLKSHHKMFHGNQAYSCKYCNLTLKLRHSLKRHLKKKHVSMEKEWNNPDVIKSMLITVSSSVEKEQQQNPTAELQLQMSDLTSTQGAEVLLAVAGIDGQILHEALTSGQAQIKKGTVPNTIEISVPVNLGNSNSNTVDNIDLDSANQSDIINLPSHNNTTPVSKVNNSQSKKTDAAITKHCLELNNEQIIVLNQELDAENQMEVRSNYQNCEKDEQNVTEHQMNNMNIGEKYVDNIVQEAQLAQLDEGQHVVITEGELPEGTHHIFVDTSQLKTIASSGESLPEGAIVVESGAVLQPESGSNVTDFLLYVLTTENQ